MSFRFIIYSDVYNWGTEVTHRHQKGAASRFVTCRLPGLHQEKKKMWRSRTKHTCKLPDDPRVHVEAEASCSELETWRTWFRCRSREEPGREAERSGAARGRRGATRGRRSRGGGRTWAACRGCGRRTPRCGCWRSCCSGQRTSCGAESCRFDSI